MIGETRYGDSYDICNKKLINEIQKYKKSRRNSKQSHDDKNSLYIKILEEFGSIDNVFIKCIQAFYDKDNFNRYEMVGGPIWGKAAEYALKVCRSNTLSSLIVNIDTLINSCHNNGHILDKIYEDIEDFLDDKARDKTGLFVIRQAERSLVMEYARNKY